MHHLKTVQTLVVDLCVFVCMETAAQVVLVSVAYEEKLSLSLYFFSIKKYSKHIFLQLTLFISYMKKKKS